jgi:hypothetical protein
MSVASAPASVVFTVNSTADDLPDYNPADGICSTTANPPYICTLRAAVMSANRASGPGATIMLPAGTYTLGIPATIADGDGDGDLNLDTPAGYAPGPTSIIGAGAGVTIIDANQIDRVLAVDAGRTVSISGVTLRNGLLGPVGSDLGGGMLCKGNATLSHVVLGANSAYGLGGGIMVYTGGVLVLNYSVVVGDNTARVSGGGIYNAGTITVSYSTLSGNSPGDGGAIANTYGIATVIRSTISAASAYRGGGIFNGNSLIVTSSTISSNNADTDGGGIYNVGMVDVYNSTIVGNQANANINLSGTGGGFFNKSAASFALVNSVVAGNYLSNSPIYDDCSGVVSTYGRNKYWVAGGGDFCTIVQHAPGSDTLLVSLGELGPLQDNGGPTQTIALVAPSNMIDGGESTFGCYDNNGTLVYDQRGFPRSAGARCDIGAFEYGIIFANGFDI